MNASIDVFRTFSSELETFDRTGPCSFRWKPPTLVIECLVVLKPLNIKAFRNTWELWGHPWVRQVSAGYVEFSASLADAFATLRLTRQNGSTSLSLTTIDGAKIGLSYQKDTTSSNWSRAEENSIFSKWINEKYHDLVREEIVWRLNEAFIRIRP